MESVIKAGGSLSFDTASTSCSSAEMLRNRRPGFCDEELQQYLSPGCSLSYARLSLFRRALPGCHSHRFSCYRFSAPCRGAICWRILELNLRGTWKTSKGTSTAPTR